MKKWIRRNRNTLGYGVQSPSDFYFVRHVLRGKSPYYAYAELHEAIVKQDSGKSLYTEEMCRLLFRLANYIHPKVIVEVGVDMQLAAYSMMLACPKARCITINAEKEDNDDMKQLVQTLQKLDKVELLHVACTPHYKEVVEMALPHVCDRTLFIIEGIDDSREKRTWWKSMQTSPHTGVSYDLGNMGLLFFDKSRFKDTYWVLMQRSSRLPWR